MAAESHSSITALEKLPRDGRRRDLVRGRLIEMPPAWPESSRIAMRLGALLLTHVGASQALASEFDVFGADAGFVLPGSDVVSPDASVIARSKLPVGAPPGFWSLVPDLAVEVLSPSDGWRDIEDKIDVYLEAGVRLLWVIDPRVRTVTIYAPNRASRTLRSPQEVLSGETVLPDFGVSLEELFAGRA